MCRLDDMLTETPMWDQLTASELFNRFERQPLIEKEQRPDDHLVLWRCHVPTRGVRP